LRFPKLREARTDWLFANSISEICILWNKMFASVRPSPQMNDPSLAELLEIFVSLISIIRADATNRSPPELVALFSYILLL